MATQLSAGVQVIETNQAPTVTPPATSVAAYVGLSIWGPANQYTLVTDPNSFETLFGPPTDTTYQDFFTVAGFLIYGQNCYFVRACDALTATNASLTSTLTITTSGIPEFITNWESITETFSVSGDKFHFYGIYPGAYGSANIQVGMVNYTDWNNRTSAGVMSGAAAEFSGLIEYGPANSTEYVIFVSTLNSDGVTYSIQEQFLVSDTPNTLDTFGNNIYINQLINTSSNYIVAFNNFNLQGQIAPSFASTNLSGGADGTTTAGDIEAGYELFNNTEAIKINYLIGGSNTSITDGLPTTIAGIANERADCISVHDVAFSMNTVYNSSVPSISPNQSDANNSQATVDYRNATNINSSYSAIYGNWLYIYDQYNDKNRWVPSSGFVAGIYALTADRNAPWFAPAGLNRGILTGVIKLAWNPKKQYRDQQYQSQVNPIVNFPGQGILIWGQKTMVTQASAFSRINVRLLFLYMESAIAAAAMYVVFEQNDSLTQSIFLNMINPFLNSIQGQQGISQFLVDVSAKVNTPQVIDNEQFIANILVSPVPAAEFITLNFVATKTGVDLTEVTV